MRCYIKGNEMVLKNELRKTFGKRTLLLLAAVCALNIALMVSGEGRKGYYFDASGYRELYRDEAMSGTVDEAISHIEALSAEIGVGGFTRDYFLYRQVKTELEAVKGYREYVEGVVSSADRLGSLPIFSSGDPFSKKNMEKTAGVYASLPAIETAPGPQRGIAMAAGNPGGTVLALVFSVFVCFSLVTRERELGSLMLTRTTFHGYLRHGAAKLICCFAAAALAVVVIELSGWITGEAMYGLGDMSRPIQSVSDFRPCVFEASVLGFAVLQALFKVFYVSALTSIVFFAVCVSASYVKLIAVSAALFGSEGVMYALISGNSASGMLKYINIFSGLDSGRLLGDYMNLNMFGNPVWLLPVVLGFITLILITFSCLGVWGYYGMDATLKGKFRLRLKAVPERTASVLVHELYRFFFCEKAAFIILAFIAFRILTFSPVHEVFTSQEDMYYKQYMLKLEGYYGSDKERIIEQERKDYEELSAKAMDAMVKAEDTVVQSLISAKYQDESRKYSVLDRVESHAYYLKEKGGAFVYDSGYKLLIGDDRGKRESSILWIMASLMMAACMSFLIAPDYQTGVDRLIRSTENGRIKLFLKRELIGTSALIVLFVICYMPFTLSVLNAYGNMGMSFPACSIESLSWCPAWLTIRGYLVLLNIFRLIMLWIEMNILFMISAKVRSISYTLAAGVGLFTIPPLIMIFI